MFDCMCSTMTDSAMFVNIDAEGLNDVNPDDAPMDVQHYLKQVAVDRNRCADIIVADNIDDTVFRKKQTPQFTNERTDAPQGLAPPVQWQLKQVADFSNMRLSLSQMRAQLKRDNKLPSVKFPDMNNEAGWKAFCQRKASSEYMSEDVHKAIITHHPLLHVHTGTPPLLKLVLSLPQPCVVDLLGFQTQWFEQEGYHSSTMHWLFSLFCVVEKPLEPDTCSSMRTLARHCATLRRSLQSNDPKAREFSWFICIVARYFDQKDLIDQ